MLNAIRNHNDPLRIPLPPEYHEWEETIEELQQPSTGGLFDITNEISNLREIKDIIDELHMIDDVLNQQKRALKMYKNVLEDNHDKSVMKLARNVEFRKSIIEQLQKDANQTYGAVSVLCRLLDIEMLRNTDAWSKIVDLLDLKQKQANVSEARSGRFQAEQATRQAVETAKQGTSIMLVSSPTDQGFLQPDKHRSSPLLQFYLCVFPFRTRSYPSDNT